MQNEKLTLIKNADVYAPEHLGITSVLIGGGKILGLGDYSSYILPDVDQIDAEGNILMPGLIDGHVHAIGGGGEDGCASRVPPLSEKKIALSGVTSLVGLLGTDGYTRTIRDLVAKVKALRQWGISAWALTGSYQLPSPTLTGSVGDDILFIDEIIGVKVAIADHRCSLPTTDELIRLASSARMASLMGRKCGIVHIHVGGDKTGISQLFEIADRTPIPLKHFYPTHMGGHMEAAKAWLKRGGHVDITCHKDAAEKVAELLAISKDEVTLSTDSNGSFPRWNEKKEIIGMGAGSIGTLYETIQSLVSSGIDRETAYALATTNPAKALRLTGKGAIRPGFDADLNLLDGDNISKTFANGKLIRSGSWCKCGMYEEENL